MAQPMNTENSFEFSMTQSLPQTQGSVPVQNLSPNRLKKPGTIGIEESLLAIHNKIRLHLTKEKPMTKVEMRKMWAILKRMKCQSPRVKKTAKSAKNILLKCFHSYSQSSEKEGKSITPKESKLTPNSLTTPHTQTSQTYNKPLTKIPISDNMELDNSSLDAINIMELGMFENKLNNSKTTLEQRGFTHSASNMFPPQTPNFTRTQENEDMLSNNDKFPFTVPTPLEKDNHYCSSAFIGSNVLKLKLGDVRLDSDSVSIPLELLTNLNFEDNSEKIGSSSCSSQHFQPSNAFVNTIDNGNTSSQHTDFQTVPSNVTNQYNKINTIDKLSSPYMASSNNIEAISTQYNLQPTNAKSNSALTINIISDDTVGTQKEPPINRATKISELNIDVNSSSNDKFTLLSNEITPFTPPKGSSDVIVINIDSSDAEATDYMFGNNVNFDLNYDDCLAPVINVDVSTSCVDKNKNLKVSDNEKRYLDMIAENDNTNDILADNDNTNGILVDNENTNDILLNTDKNSIVLCETNIDESQEDNNSFIFDLGPESTDLIEGTPFDIERKNLFHHKIQTQFHKNQAIRGAPSGNHKIPNKSQVNTIDETPSNDTSETPELSAALESSSASGEVPFSGQNPIKKKRKLAQNFETQAPSKSILGPCEGDNYYNPPEIKISTASKLALTENGIKENTGVVQSQSLSDFSLKDMEIEPCPSNSQGMDQTTNIIVIDGSIQKNTEPMSISQEEEETFEAKDRKMYEQIMHKRNKYKEKWNKKTISEKVSYKYVNKFGINILEDPPELLLDLSLDVPVNNYHFSRFTLKEIAEKQNEWFHYQTVLDECAKKMVEKQISSNNQDDNRLAGNHLDSTDSDSSDEEQILRKKLLKEITLLPTINFDKKCMDTGAEEKKNENKENDTQNMFMENIEDGEEEINNLNENREELSLESMLRFNTDLNWLK